MIIVTGMPRSGTSLMMRLLFYLDVPITGDLFPIGRNKAHNVNGFFESVDHLGGNLKRIDHTENFGVKVHLRKLIEKVEPDPVNHKIIFCYRNIDDMTNSQMNKTGAESSTFARSKIQNQKWYGKIDGYIGSTPHLKVFIETLMANKSAGVSAIKTFLGADRETSKAISIIN